MKIRTIYVLGHDRELQNRLSELAMHHPSLERPQYIPSRASLKALLKGQPDPVIIIEKSQHPTPEPHTLRELVPYHLQDQCIIVQASQSSHEVERFEGTDYDFVIPETPSFSQFDYFVSSANKEVSCKVKSRYSKAISILAEEMGAQLDQIAYLKKKGYKAHISEEVFKDMSSAVKTLRKHERELFFEAFEEYCSRAKPLGAEFHPRKRYVGVSTRVRKNMTCKAWKRFDEASLLMKKLASN